MTFEDDTADNTGYHAMRPIGCTSGSHHRCGAFEKRT